MHTVQLRTHNTHAHSLVSFWYDGKCRQTKRIHNIDNSNEENWKMCRDKQKSARREVLLCFWEWNITAEIPSLTTDEKKDKFAKKTNKQQRCTNVNPYSKIHLKPYNCSVRMSKRQTDTDGEWATSPFANSANRLPPTHVVAIHNIKSAHKNKSVIAVSLAAKCIGFEQKNVQTLCNELTAEKESN